MSISVTHIGDLATIVVVSKVATFQLVIDTLDWKGFSTLIVTHTHEDFISKNYATQDIYSGPRINLKSRNSPSILRGTIYLHGAFPEFNRKPYSGLNTHLFALYKKEKDILGQVYDLATDLEVAINLIESKL